jgi:DNA-binding transcriptional LysR family regulator
LDIVLTALPVREGPFTVLPVYRDEHILVVRSSDPLAGRDEVSLPELAELELIAIDDCRTQSETETALAADGWPLKVTRRLEDRSAILAFVSAGLGVGFIPSLAAELPDGLRAVQLAPGVPSRVIAAVRHSEAEPDARCDRFVKLAASVSSSARGPAGRASPAAAGR